MYDQEEMFWFNHNLITHMDKEYQTNSHIRLALSISTTDYLKFGQTYMMISISNYIEKKNRTYSLNIQNCSDIIRAFKQIVDNYDKAFSENYKIIRKYNKDKSLIFEFFEQSDTKEKLIKIQIFHNESNFGSVIVDYPLFQMIAIQIRSFTSDYIRISGDLRRDFIGSRNLFVNNKLSNDIRNFPNQLINVSNFDINDKTENIKIVDIPESKLIETKPQIDDNNIESELNNFIGGEEMSNINLNINVDIPEPIKRVNESNNNFVENVLKGDLKNLEGFLTSVANTSSNPFESIGNELKLLDNDLDLLPGISDTDVKSISYISKLFYSYHFQNYIENNEAIPVSASILKYNTNNVNVSPDNINLAYDLLTIMGYLKCFRSKVELKNSDAFSNKSLMYLAYRCFMDVYIFSFITEKWVRFDTLQTIILERFKYFNEIGFFDKFKEELENSNCEYITEPEMSLFIQQVIDGPIIGGTPYIDEFHKNSSQVFKLMPDNEFNIEQIVNEIVPLEVNQRLGNPLEDFLVDKPENIKKLFLKSHKNPIAKKSNLLSFISKFISKESSEFKIIQSTYSETKNLNLNKLEGIKLEELDEEVIKALYLWEPEIDQKIKNNYNYFKSKIEEEMMTKDLIITKVKTQPEINIENNEWNINDLEIN